MKDTDMLHVSVSVIQHTISTQIIDINHPNGITALVLEYQA
jgi:hypothetical protein